MQRCNVAFEADSARVSVRCSKPFFLPGIGIMGGTPSICLKIAFLALSKT